ncbi:MAG: hypothetical protein ACT4OM_09000 [Actinomycetota bacterium]
MSSAEPPGPPESHLPDAAAPGGPAPDGAVMGGPAPDALSKPDAGMPGGPAPDGAVMGGPAPDAQEVLPGAPTPVGQDLSSRESMFALVAGILGVTLETLAFASFLLRLTRSAERVDASLIAADGAVLFLALLGAGLLIRTPNQAAGALAGAGIGSILSDIAGLSTPPRMIPGGMMILGATLTYAMRKENGERRSIDLQRPQQPSWLPILAGISIGLHVVGGGFIGIGAGLVATPIGLLAGWLIWAAILFAAVRVRRRQPWLTVASPLLGIGAWVLLVVIGSRFLGWQA